MAGRNLKIAFTRERLFKNRKQITHNLLMELKSKVNKMPAE